MRRADLLRDQLEQDIVIGAFRPGERLDEQSLAARFNVSRTPIREALQQLVSAGLVTAQPNRGVFVASLGVRDVVERFEAMAALEGMCGRLAARRISDSERRALTDAHEACAREAARGDADAYYYLHKRLKPYRRLQLRLRNRVPTSLKEHQAIVDAILAGDGDRAEQMLKDHVLIQGERLSDFVATLDPVAAT